MAQARYTQQSLFDNVGLSPARATNVRPTQFAGMQAAAQFETTRANVKNRLAKMLDPIATSYIENEALKYSAENPVTQEQLDDITGKGDVSDLGGNDFTVRGKILKRARAVQVSNALANDAEAKAISLLPKIESGELKHDQVLTQLNEIIDGYTGAVAKLDPQVAIKFRARVSALGNNLYQKAINLDIERNKALQNKQFLKNLESFKTKSILKLQNYETTANNLFEIEEQLNKDKTEFLNGVDFRNLASATSMLDKFIIDAKVDFISTKLSDAKYLKKHSITKIVQGLSVNNIPGGDQQLNAMFANLPLQQKNQIEQDIYNLASKIYTIKQRNESELKKEREQTLAQLTVDYKAANEQDKKTIKDKMVQISVDLGYRQDQIDSFLDEKKLNDKSESFIRNQIYDNNIDSYKDLVDLVINKGGNYSDILELQPLLNQNLNEEIRNLKRLIGIIPSADPRQQLKNRKQERRLLLHLNEERRNQGDKFNELKSIREFVDKEVPRLTEIDLKEEVNGLVSMSLLAKHGKKTEDKKEIVRQLNEFGFDKIDANNLFLLSSSLTQTNSKDQMLIEYLNLLRIDGKRIFTESESESFKEYSELLKSNSK